MKINIYDLFNGKKLHSSEWEIVSENKAFVVAVSPTGYELKFSKKTGKQVGFCWPRMTLAIDAKD